MFDVIIIGGGPAGVAAANYSRARGLDVALFERRSIGGLITYTTLVTHYPSLPIGIKGVEFGELLENQLENNKTKVFYENINSIDVSDKIKRVSTNRGEYEAKALIIATGSTPKSPEFKSKGKYTIYADAFKCLDNCKGKEVFVLGGSDGACKEALTLSKYADKVHIVQIQDKLLTIDEFAEQINANPNIDVIVNSELFDVDGLEHDYNKVSIKNVKTNEVQTFEGGRYDVFAYIGQYPNNELFKDIIKIDDSGFIDASDSVFTSVEGVFSCGDINKKNVRQIATAVSDGALAGIAAKKYIIANF